MRNHRFLKQALGFVLSAVLLLSQPLARSWRYRILPSPILTSTPAASTW